MICIPDIRCPRFNVVNGLCHPYTSQDVVSLSVVSVHYMGKISFEAIPASYYVGATCICLFLFLPLPRHDIHSGFIARSTIYNVQVEGYFLVGKYLNGLQLNYQSWAYKVIRNPIVCGAVPSPPMVWLNSETPYRLPLNFNKVRTKSKCIIN
jgi:hypothetical protein